MDHEEFVALGNLLYILQKVLGGFQGPKTLKEVVTFVCPALAFILLCLSLPGS